MNTASQRARSLRRLLPILLWNMLLPYGSYLVLTQFGVATVPALAISAIPPAAMTIVTIIRSRRVDPIGALSLFVIAVGIGTSFITGNGQFAVAKDSLFSLALGIASLVSLFGHKPLLYRLVETVRSGEGPAAAIALDRVWQGNADFRRTLRRYTMVWAAVTLLAVGVKLAIAFSLPVGTSLPLLQILDPAIFVALFVVTRRAVLPYRAALIAAA